MRVAVQAVTQVGTELSAGHHGVQIAVRGRDDPGVGLDRLISADALELLLLDRAQDLALHQQRHVAHLVQKEGAAVAFLELADALAHGPGKSPFFVAEEFAFQERFGNCRTVDGQELLSGPIAVLMDRPGDEFFARPALAADEHVDVLIGDAADSLVDLLHGRTVSDQGVGGGRWPSVAASAFSASSLAAVSRIRLLIPIAWPITSRILAMSKGLLK